MFDRCQSIEASWEAVASFPKASAREFSALGICLI